MAETDERQRCNHRPLIGAAQLAMTRGAMRMINVLPPVKRRILKGIMRVRGEN